MRVVIAGGHVAALLDNPGTGHQTLVGGDTPVAAAVRSIS